MKPKIIINVYGGVVQGVYASQDVELKVYDFDNEDTSEEEFNNEVDGLIHIIGE